MATTASGELAGFHHLHHDQYYPSLHDAYHQHHAFQPPNVSSYHDVLTSGSGVGTHGVSSGYGMFGDQRNTVTPSPPESEINSSQHHHHTGFDIKNLGLISSTSSASTSAATAISISICSNDEVKSNIDKSPNFYLPPIGDALSRRGDKTSSSRQNVDDDSVAEKCRDNNSEKFSGLCKLTSLSQTSSNRSKTSESRQNNKLNNSSPQRATEFTSNSSTNIKNEDNTAMLYDLRNFAQQFGHALRDSPHESGSEMNLLPSNNNTSNHGDCTSSASVELFFRSEATQSSCDNRAANDVTAITEVTQCPTDVPSYATLTPLQSLPPITSGVAMSAGNNSYATLIGGPDIGCDQGYSKMGGMGHALPPLSNRMLLNGFAAQSGRGSASTMQTQATAMDVVNHAAAAAAVASFSPYTKAAGQPVIGSNIISQQVGSNPYETGMFGGEVAAFQGHHHPHMFPPPHRAAAFVPQYQPSAFPTDLASSIHSSGTVPSTTALVGRRSSRPAQSQHQKSCGEQAIKQHKNNVGNTGVNLACMDLSDRAGSGTSQSIEEVNTKAVAAKVTAELKRYSIPQAVFAQKILHRSQGTLSDLLRNPKPWSKLKSGRETFRRMFKWLQIPEETRMPDLRLAGQI